MTFGENKVETKPNEQISKADTGKGKPKGLFGGFTCFEGERDPKKTQGEKRFHGNNPKGKKECFSMAKGQKRERRVGKNGR